MMAMRLGGFLDFLFPPRKSLRMVREGSAQLASFVTLRTISETGVIALLPYRENLVKAFITEAKFYGNKLAQKTLGSILADYLQEYVIDEHALTKQSYVLVPIPLSKKRRTERGYNQVEEICKEAASTLPGLVTLVPEALKRIRDTAPQTSLSAHERKENVRGAFTTPRTLSASSFYMVIDDVITTGATMREAEAALREGGAQNVACLSLSY